MTTQNDTIVAIATPAGRGGVGIVRVSGPLSQCVAQTLLGHVPKPRYAHYLPFYDEVNNVIDQGIALFFKAPNSYTGDDIIEFQGHGGVVVLDRLVKTILKQPDVRLARSGEFTERAFLNNKIDLIQAESIADLIDATSEQAAKSAIRSLQGEFSKKINRILEQLTHLRMYVEAAIDFPEEEIDFLQDTVIQDSCQIIIATLNATLLSAEQGALLRDGIHVVIAGKPNAGKSSLLNRLSGKNTAIVTHIAGTTRDVLREKIVLDGLLINIIDTAGLRDTDDIIEKEGVKRALQEIHNADIVLFIVDVSTTQTLNINDLWPHSLTPFPARAAVIVVNNKIDLMGQKPQLIDHDHLTSVNVSVKNNEGVDLLIGCLKKKVGFHTVSENTFIARRRHLDALQRTLTHVNDGYSQLKNARAGELLAEELRLAQLSLSEITGEFVADDLLGKIFSSFCIGK